MSKISYIKNIDEWSQEFTFKHPVKVRFSETDMFGHLNNTVPFAYFEEARIEFFKNLGFMQDWLKMGSDLIPVVADLQCDYLQQVFFNDELSIYVKANSVGTSSVDVHYMGVRGMKDVCFTGRGTIVQISKSAGKSVPWTEEEKALMKKPETDAKKAEEKFQLDK
ncbi:acyl-CoA thioesterase [Bacillus massiliglaciei]|uniref:acyl-CoA thioesterase n=1 Tax=Bacillus massiliglaciei TaxID=1816693 RepID=UPI000AE569B7|nr:thioesterase family protein [Bacillus massiliglaciei]